MMRSVADADTILPKCGDGPTAISAGPRAKVSPQKAWPTDALVEDSWVEVYWVEDCNSPLTFHQCCNPS